MQFKSRQDIAATIDEVFAAVTDFDGFERQALRRGAEVSRIDSPRATLTGATWDIRFNYRRRDRHLILKITDAEVPDLLRITAEGRSVTIKGTVELLALSRIQTRLTVTLDITPLTLSARLLVQSLKLARSTIVRRLDKRVETFAREIEARTSRAG